MKKLYHHGTLACFTPAVMLATFFAELVLVIYTLLFRKLNLSTRLAVFLLAILATFQLTEYGICESLGLGNSTWAKLGFSTITLLPPLGLHLVFTLSRKKNILVLLSYGAAAIWIGFFVFGNIMSRAVCEGNYVIFHFADPYEGLYYLFYNSLMILAIGFAIVYAKRAKVKRAGLALYWLAFGYTSFLIPSMVFAKISSYRGVDSPLPSIMCGFAVIFAIILSTKVLAHSSPKK